MALPLLSPSAAEWLADYGLFYNLFSFFHSALPLRYRTGSLKGHPSDGLQILTALKQARQEKRGR